MNTSIDVFNFKGDWFLDFRINSYIISKKYQLKNMIDTKNSNISTIDG